MRRLHSTLLMSIVYACVVAIAGTGCHRESTPQAHAAPERPSPEKSFDAIAEIVKEGIEMRGGDVSGFVAKATGASSRFQVHNTVTYQAIPPASPNESYRGTITVTSQSIYSLRRSAEDEAKKKKDDKDAAADKSSGGLDDADDAASGFNSFDKGLVGDATGDDDKTASVEMDSVQRRADEVKRTYDLVYKDGRWELVTTLDPKTEASVENAFKRALSLQP